MPTPIPRKIIRSFSNDDGDGDGDGYGYGYEDVT